MKSENQARGFTLAEAAIAIAVVAILAGIIIPLVMKSVRSSRRARARNDIQVIVAAIASQLKDTGTRPWMAGGPGGSTGIGDSIWVSGGGQARLMNGGLLDVGNDDRDSTFTNLFTFPECDEGNVLFGLPAADRRGEFRYRGPYMSVQMARKSDPWGNAYIILGYNAWGRRSNGPIWVLSMGEAGTIADANFAENDVTYRCVDVWDYAAPGSATNIAVRVN